MPFYKKPFTAHYAIATLLAVVLLFYSFKLHRYSNYSQRLITAIQHIQNDSVGNNAYPCYDSNFKNNIEKQLALAPVDGMDWAGFFKKDSSAFPKNVLTHAFKNMQRFDVVMDRLSFNDDTVTCRLFVRDKKPFNVTAKFIKKGDAFLIDDLENISALYSRLNCYNHYLHEGKAQH